MCKAQWQTHALTKSNSERDVNGTHRPICLLLGHSTWVTSNIEQWLHAGCFMGIASFAGCPMHSQFLLFLQPCHETTEEREKSV